MFNIEKWAFMINYHYLWVQEHLPNAGAIIKNSLQSTNTSPKSENSFEMKSESAHIKSNSLGPMKGWSG